MFFLFFHFCLWLILFGNPFWFSLILLELRSKNHTKGKSTPSEFSIHNTWEYSFFFCFAVGNIERTENLTLMLTNWKLLWNQKIWMISKTNLVSLRYENISSCLLLLSWADESLVLIKLIFESFVWKNIGVGRVFPIFWIFFTRLELGKIQRIMIY